MEIVEQQNCTECDRIYCNGMVHQNPLAPFVYPICNTCGIELCDLIELLENAELRDPNVCELCSLEYESVHHPNTHFEAHFYQSTNSSSGGGGTSMGRCQIRFYCLRCLNANDTETTSAKSDNVPMKNRENARGARESIRTEHTTITRVTEHRTHETRISSIDYPEQCTDTDEPNDMIAVKSEDVIYEPEEDQTESVEYIEEESCEDEEEKYVYHETSEADDENSINTTNNKPFKCEKCVKTFGTKLEMIFHKMYYHSNRPRENRNVIKCPVCEQTFQSTPARLHHVNLEHRDLETNRIQCLYCSKQFKHISSIVDHMLTHEEKKGYICDLCGKGFRRLGNLQGHYATHNDEASYACHLCSKSYKTAQLRKKHIQYVHSPVKRLKCEQCEKRFSDHSDLRRHRWSHGGYEKKFACPFCEKKFFEHKCLRIHEKTHFRTKRRRIGNETVIL